MSKVMKDLQQSEQAYQAQMSPTYRASLPPLSTKSTNKMWLLAALLLVPIVVVLGWIVLSSQWLSKERQSMPLPTSVQSELKQSESISRESTLPKSIQPKSTQPDASLVHAQILPYPSLPAQTDLPGKPIVKTPVKVVRSKPSTVENSDSGKIIKTDQVDVSQDQDWNVDNLDLSGLSPELAKRFESALNPQSSGSQTKARSPANPQPAQNTVNLVGNESDYRGRLPKMNFETHMYSTKAQSRWIKVNGHEVHEGEWIIGKLVKLEKILPGSLIVDFDNQQLQIPALYEWAG